MDIKDEVIELLIAKAPMIFGPVTREVELGPETTFAELDGKSVNIVQMSALLEDEYEIEVPFMALAQRPTFGSVGELIDELLSM